MTQWNRIDNARSTPAYSVTLSLIKGPKIYTKEKIDYLANAAGKHEEVESTSIYLSMYQNKIKID